MTLVNGRLHNVLEQAGFNNFTDYFNYLIADRTGDAVITFVNRITTNHTFFMREANHFYYFRDQVLPYLKNNVKNRDLRIWCAACSTGEESYTLAMIIDEYLNTEKHLWDRRVLATDISEKVLSAANNGVYENDRIASLPSIWRLNYFRKIDNDKSVVVDQLKNEVIYRRFNLMDEVFPFKRKFHTIFCRNVMIYFDNATKDKLVEKLYNHLEYGGYLFLGSSESINKETAFKHIIPSVYRKV